MVVFVIIGALIGAGFASGQEIYLFFYRYGKWGILGLGLCSAIIGLIIYKTFNMLLNKKIKNYREFLDEIYHTKNKNRYFNLSNTSDIIINIFLLITFYIMISGFGTYFYQEYNINRFIGAIVLASVCLIVLKKNIQGVVKANSIIVPILIICIIIIGIRCVFHINLEKVLEGRFIVDESIIQKSIFNNNSFELFIKSIWQSIIYCSYNIILLLPVLVNLQKYIKNRKQIITISIMSSIIIFILALCIFILLLNVNIEKEVIFNNIEMPAVYCISKIFPEFRNIYGIIILLSIFTTAVSIGASFLQNISKNKKSYTQFAVSLCITSVLISNIGFSNLVKVMFPAFGYLGIIQIALLIRAG